MDFKKLFKKTKWKNIVKGTLLKFAPCAIAVASVITAVTPNQTDDAVLNAIVKTLNVAALNVGQNSNVDE